MEEIYKIECRLCGNEISLSDPKNAIEIFKQKNLKQKIEFFLHIEVIESDKLANIICKSCHTDLDDFDDLAKMSMMSQKYFCDRVFQDNDKGVDERNEPLATDNVEPPLSGNKLPKRRQLTRRNTEESAYLSFATPNFTEKVLSSKRSVLTNEVTNKAVRPIFQAKNEEQLTPMFQLQKAKATKKLLKVTTNPPMPQSHANVKRCTKTRKCVPGRMCYCLSPKAANFESTNPFMLRRTNSVTLNKSYTVLKKIVQAPLISIEPCRGEQQEALVEEQTVVLRHENAPVSICNATEVHLMQATFEGAWRTTAVEKQNENLHELIAKAEITNCESVAEKDNFVATEELQSQLLAQPQLNTAAGDAPSCLPQENQNETNLVVSQSLPVTQPTKPLLSSFYFQSSASQQPLRFQESIALDSEVEKRSFQKTVNQSLATTESNFQSNNAATTEDQYMSVMDKVRRFEHQRNSRMAR